MTVIDDGLIERLRKGVIVLGFGPNQGGLVDTVTANQAMRKAADTIERLRSDHKVLREALERISGCRYCDCGKIAHEAIEAQGELRGG